MENILISSEENNFVCRNSEECGGLGFDRVLLRGRERRVSGIDIDCGFRESDRRRTAKNY